MGYKCGNEYGFEIEFYISYSIKWCHDARFFFLRNDVPRNGVDPNF